MAKKQLRKDVPSYPAFPSNGVLYRADDPDYAQAVVRADAVNGGLDIHMPGISPVKYPSDDVTVDGNTGRLNFTSTGTPFGIRELREDDGSWLSRYKTLLPLPALGSLIGRVGDAEGMATANPNDARETLDAYSTEDSPYIVGVLYTNNAGRWSREGGDWIPVSPDDATFSTNDDDLIVTPIDPDRADQFLSMFDQNYVSVADAERFEQTSDDNTVDQ